MKREGNELVQFLVGIIMLVAGLYWFASSGYNRILYLEELV